MRTLTVRRWFLSAGERFRHRFIVMSRIKSVFLQVLARKSWRYPEGRDENKQILITGSFMAVSQAALSYIDAASFIIHAIRTMRV